MSRKALVLIGATGLIGGGTCLWLWFRSPDAAELFQHYADVPLPPSAIVLSANDDRQGFQWEGVFHLVCEVSESELDGLLLYPPWPGIEWRAGPLPDSMPLHWPPHAKPSPPTAQSVANNASWGSIRYTAQDFRYAPTPWQDGRVMIVDTDKLMIWFLAWNL